MNFKACALEIVGVITYFETLHKYTKKIQNIKYIKKKQKVGKIKIKYTLGRKTWRTTIKFSNINWERLKYIRLNTLTAYF